jgi:hypothetical protein
MKRKTAYNLFSLALGKACVAPVGASKQVTFP